MVGTKLVQGSVLLALSFALSASARPSRPLNPKDFRVLSLNLHAYHPMGEPERFTQDKTGKIEDAHSDIFFFTPTELDRGNRKRLDSLAKAVSDLQPDLILFQEVTAGSPGHTSCQDFHAPFQKDALHENTVARLQRRMTALGQNYQQHLACRGNIGWTTDAKTFKEKQIVKLKPDGSPEVVIPFNANPYPKGLVIEGLAILARAPIQILDHQMWSIEFNENKDLFFVQTLVFSVDQGRGGPNSPVYVISNIHGGHKVPHFEQSVALRRKIDNYISLATWKDRFQGLFIGGDFNGALYRPQQQLGFIESTPWEVAVEGNFDLRVQNPNFDPAALIKRLHDLNALKDYKPWATITDPAQAKRRINAAVQNFIDWQKNALKASFPTVLHSSLWRAQQQKLCQPMMPWNISCSREKNIDQIFYSPNLTLKTAFLAFSDASWSSTVSLSDHPAMQAHFDLTLKKKGSF